MNVSFIQKKCSLYVQIFGEASYNGSPVRLQQKMVGSRMRIVAAVFGERLKPNSRRAVMYQKR